MSHVRNKQGFTIIELMLSMTFIAVLLVIIALTTIQISNIYNKGITLKEVNQAGRSVSADLQRSVASVSVFEVNPAAPGTKYVVRPGGGRLCIGQFSYAWNYGNARATGVPAVYNRYTPSNQPVNFAKVRDPGGEYCRDTSRPITQADATELIGVGDRNLAIHRFTITTAPSATDTATGQALYAISMTIGTNDQQLLETTNTACRPPSTSGVDDDFCSVNQFDLVARAGNKLGEQ